MTTRWVLVVVLACTVLHVATATMTMCPFSGTTDYYNATSACLPFNLCRANYCLCIGAIDADAHSDFCIWGSNPRPTCSRVQGCLTTLMPCFNTATVQPACSGATSLVSLHVGLLQLASGEFYNGSSVEMSCERHTCRLVNSSVVSEVCDMTSIASSACVPPYTFNGTIALSGQWLASTATDAQIMSALAMDLSNELGMPIDVTMIVSRTATQLVANFVAPVAATNTALQSNLAAASSSPMWLVRTQTLYASTGGPGSITVLSIGSTTPAPPPTTSTVSPAPTTTMPFVPTTLPPPQTPIPNAPMPAWKFQLTYQSGHYPGQDQLRIDLRGVLEQPADQTPSIAVQILQGEYQPGLTSSVEFIPVNTVTEIEMEFTGPDAVVNADSLERLIVTETAAVIAGRLGATGITAQSTASNSSPSPSKTGLIVGVVIGCVVGVALIVGAILFCLKRRGSGHDEELLSAPQGGKVDKFV